MSVQSYQSSDITASRVTSDVTTGQSRNTRQDKLGNQEVQAQGVGAQASGGAGGGTGTPTAARGGGNWTIQRGDTLWRIAKKTYGQGKYWRQIMEANPGKVRRGGDLIIDGEVLAIPTIDVPIRGEGPNGPAPAPPAAPPVPAPTAAPPAPEPAPAPGVEVPVADVPAVTPRGICTEYGNFTLYPDDYVGQLPKPIDGSEALREGMLRPTLSTREMIANMDRQAKVSDIDDLLSYGASDWAITDAEATRALGLLGSLPLSQLQRAVGQININRLLSNLPDSQRKTPAFTRVVVALGPSGAGPYLQDLLSYGVFDWAVTDAEVREVVGIVTQFPMQRQLELFTSLGAKFQARFATNLPTNSGMSSEQMKTLFDLLPDTELDALQKLMGVRFGLDVKGKDGGQWDAPGLRRGWTILEQLPPDHVLGNDKLDSFMRDSAQQGSGYYNGNNEAVIGYGWSDKDAKGTPGAGKRAEDGSEDTDLEATGSYGSFQGVDASGNRVNVNLHAGINLFNTVVRHEIGHAVDSKLGVTKEGGYARSTETAGMWEEYAGAEAFVTAAIAAGGGMDQYATKHADAPAAWEKALRRAVKDAKDFNVALQELREAKEVAADVPDAPPGVGGPVDALLSIDNWHPDKNPWYDNPNRPPSGTRIFQKAYTWGRWVSYKKDARLKYGVSSYQWRAPGEWFAEAYACYYSDHDSPAGTPMGTRLRTRDSATAGWIDTNVDKGFSLQKQTNQAPGAPAASPGSAPGPTGTTAGGRT